MVPVPLPFGRFILCLPSTRERLLDAACRILSEDTLSHLSIDRLAERAGLSRRTFFLHFTSKDQLLADVLEHIRPSQAAAYRQWTEGLDPALSVEERICALFGHVVEMISTPGWRGGFFVRLSAECADRAGHPVHRVVAEAHHDMERWLTAELERGDYLAPEMVAKQLVLLLNGLLVMQFVHRSDAYSAATQAMLPGILASGRLQGVDEERPVLRLAATG